MTYIAQTGAWQARAVAALPHLTRFERGEIAVQGSRFRISGEAAGSLLAHLKEDMAEISDGYAVEYQVTETDLRMPELVSLDLIAPGELKAVACQKAFDRVADVNRIVFASNRTRITRSSGPALDKFAALARACSDFPLEIQGHTDSRGQRDANLALSRERAIAVKDYLVDRGLSADRLTAVGFGPDRPAASNRTETGRARNRRIEFRIVRGE
jgi:OOP family OmpA-OmpF porin